MLNQFFRLSDAVAEHLAVNDHPRFRHRSCRRDEAPGLKRRRHTTSRISRLFCRAVNSSDPASRSLSGRAGCEGRVRGFKGRTGGGLSLESKDDSAGNVRGAFCGDESRLGKSVDDPLFGGSDKSMSNASPSFFDLELSTDFEPVNCYVVGGIWRCFGFGSESHRPLCPTSGRARLDRGGGDES